VTSRTNALVARIPSLFRPLVDRIGFPGTTVPDAIARSSPTGLDHQPATAGTARTSSHPILRNVAE